MEDGLNSENNGSVKMGASSNPKSLAELQERKKTLEETINKRNQELRQLCIQEAELTGVMPSEIPLEPGESPPTFRKKIYTHYQLPQNLIDNLNKEEESISELELALQIQAKQAEAALGLANEANVTKTVRRQHMQQYQQHKQQYNILKEKLEKLKCRSQNSQHPASPSQQQKQKKKPRPLEQDDTVSMNEPFGKSTLRHSMRSLQNPSYTSGTMDQRYMGHQRLAYRCSEGGTLVENKPYIRQEDILTSGIFRLSINGYKNYVERQESAGTPENQMTHQQYICSQSTPSLHHQHIYPHNQTAVHTLPHLSQRSPQNILSPNTYATINSHYNHPVNHQQMLHEYNKYNSNAPHVNSHTSTQIQRQASPSINSSSSSNMKMQYFPSHAMHVQASYRPYSTVDQNYRTFNPHQIQPHQQYEHDVMTSGLGGFWKRTENGELIWYKNISTVDSTWQRNKRFGSLDRRKNKRLHKRTSPNVDTKSATISCTQVYNEPTYKVPVKTQQTASHSSQDNRQLVRTQSLGSVGAQTIDSVWPSDDNSSCESDAHSFNEINAAQKKQKQKEWYETSLDGPATPTTRSYSTIPIAPEEKYVETPHLTPPAQTPKLVLEIPAESNPSPRVQETNMEIFNNNIPKNCTVVQAGQWKPYHEETKPFEMSDFYKYSTKYKKSPSKHDNEGIRTRSQSIGFRQLPSPQGQQRQNVINDNYEDDNASVILGVYQPLQPMKCQPYSPTNSANHSVGSPTSLNTSLDLSQLTSNVAENFSAEMNAWYQNHEHQTGNNDSTQMTKQRSTATLV